MPDATQIETIETLTQAASLAAAQGEWDRVVHCYTSREALLAGMSLSPEALTRVQTLDRQIEIQARVAQAGLASLMGDAARIRQRLKGLRQGQGALSSDSGTIGTVA